MLKKLGIILFTTCYWFQGNCQMVVGHLNNGVAEVVLSETFLEQSLIDSGLTYGITNIDLISMSMDYNPEVENDNPGYFIFKFSYRIPNDPLTYFCSVAHNCNLNTENGNFTIVNGGEQKKVTCKAKNCGEGCSATRNDCTDCWPQNNEAHECLKETTQGGGNLGNDIIKMLTGAIITLLITHCC